MGSVPKMSSKIAEPVALAGMGVVLFEPRAIAGDAIFLRSEVTSMRRGAMRHPLHHRGTAPAVGLALAVLLGSAGHAGAPPQSPPKVPSVRLYVFDCGVLKRGDPSGYGLTRSQVGSTDFSDPCFLVVHPRGTMLWDVGIIPDDQIAPGGVEQPAANGINRATRTLRSQLQEIGYGPRDITYLALSHGHADHVANANEYARSTLLIQSKEWDFIFSDAQRKASFFPTYRALLNSKVLKLNGHHDVFGDGTVVLESTPGHTPGHQSLFVKLAKTGPILLTGDLYHYPAERALKTFRAEDNIPQTRASRAEIEELLRKTGAQLWIQHDILANATLKKSPQYYD
jgi:glyoxylase-like metal-dependent hydrolase (beta-lactamase superfamily II)